MHRTVEVDRFIILRRSLLTLGCYITRQKRSSDVPVGYLPWCWEKFGYVYVIDLVDVRTVVLETDCSYGEDQLVT